MIGCLRTRVRKQPIIALYYEFETILKFHNLEARSRMWSLFCLCNQIKHMDIMFEILVMPGKLQFAVSHILVFRAVCSFLGISQISVFRAVCSS